MHASFNEAGKGWLKNVCKPSVLSLKESWQDLSSQKLANFS